MPRAFFWLTICLASPEHGDRFHMCRVREHIGNTRPQHLVAFGIDQHIGVACQGSRVAGYIHNGVRRVATRRISIRQRLNQGMSAVPADATEDSLYYNEATDRAECSACCASCSGVAPRGAVPFIGRASRVPPSGASCQSKNSSGDTDSTCSSPACR